MAKTKPEEGELPDLEKTTVTLPWEAFRELLDVKKPEDAEQPPQPWVMKRASYSAEISGGAALVAAEFEVEVLGDGWVHAPLLPTEGLALKSARLDKKDVVLSAADGHHALTLKGKGSYKVSIVFEVPLNDPDSDESGLSLTLVPSPVTVFEVKIAKSDLEVSIEPNFGLNLDASKKQTRVSAAIGATESVSVSWRTKDDKPEIRVVPLVSAESATSIAVGERVLTLTTNLQLNIQKSPIDSIAVLLPEGVTFLAAEGDAVREWEQETVGGVKRARVRFHYDVEGVQSLTLRAERAFKGDGKADAAIDVESPVLVLAWDKAWHEKAAEASAAGKEATPLDHAKSAVEPLDRQKGSIGISAEARTEVKTGRTQNLTAIDVKELPGNTPRSAQPFVHAFRFSRVPWALPLSVAVHEDLAVLVATVDHAHVETILLEDGRVLSKAYLDVRNNSRQFLKVRLPAGAKLWSAFRSERPVKPAADAEGTVRIPLAKPGEGTPFTIELAWFVPGATLGAGGLREIPMPAFDLPVSYYSAQLYLPRRFRHYNFDGGLKRVENLSRAFAFRGAIEGNEPGAMMMNTQTRAPSPSSGGDGGGGSAGQLPIRIPMIRRGLEARFERTLVVDEAVAVKWECKRRKTDVS